VTPENPPAARHEGGPPTTAPMPLTMVPENHYLRTSVIPPVLKSLRY